jgi:hypothetical protein
MLSEEESAERFEDADENEDGKVTWEEYKADSYGMDGSGEDNVIQSSEEESVNVADIINSIVNFSFNEVFIVSLFHNIVT